MAVSDYLTQQQVEEMMNQRFGVPEGTPRSSPLDFQYQEEEYPDSISRSRLYNQREGMYSPKMQTQDPDAYYKNVQALQDDSRPRMGILDYKGPFSKPEDREWPYVEYEETADKPGGHSWQHNYVYDEENPTLDYETNPMLMQALINQRQSNLHGPNLPESKMTMYEALQNEDEIKKRMGTQELADDFNRDYEFSAENWRNKLGNKFDTVKGKVGNWKDMVGKGITGAWSALSGFPGMALGAFQGPQLTPQQQAMNNQFLQDYNVGVGTQQNPFQMTSGPFQGMNAPGTSAMGSPTSQAMAQKWMNKYGKMDYQTEKQMAKQKEIRDIAVGNRNLPPSERQGPGDQGQHTTQGRAAGTGTTRTGHGKSGMGRDPDRFAAEGGLISLWPR